MNKKEHYLFYRWKSMMGRCYCPSNKDYKFYGAKGVTVSPELRNFWSYVKIVESLPNADKLKEGWQIDKDKLSVEEKIYSKETIQILSPEENRLFKECGGGRPSNGIEVEFITGEIISYDSSEIAGRELGIDGSSVRKIANGKASGKTIFKRKGIVSITWQDDSRG